MSATNRTIFRTGLLCAFAAIAMLVACDEKKETPSTAPSATPTAATASAAPTASESAEADTEEDFEEEAEKSITADNLEAELTKLEAEIK